MAKEKRRWMEKAVQLLSQDSQKVFSKPGFISYLYGHWDALEAPRSLSPGAVLKHFLETGQILQIKIQPAEGIVNKQGTPYPEKVRYTWGEVSTYQIALSIRTPSYFSHASAIHLHGLTQEDPKTIYVNREQSPKPSKSIVSQEAIDRAFKAKPRTSNYIYGYNDYRIVLLNGKHTGNLEVTELRRSEDEYLPVTKLERTLIDSVVRPTYAGGIFHVREAFQNAMERISVNVLIATLKKLDHTYPYHQSIGFLLETCGYQKSNLAKLKDLGIEYDYYLDYGMKDPRYNSTWKIYYPKGF